MSALRRVGPASRPLLRALRGRLGELRARAADRITERVGEHWIAWRSERAGRVFAEVRPHRRGIEIFILPGPRELDDPTRLVRRAPRTQGWGWFRGRIDVTSPEEVGPAFRAIRQSYEFGRRSPNGRSPRR